MKIKKMLFAAFLTAALLGGNSLFAQSSSYLNLGLSIPQGEFGSKTDNCALLNPNSTMGGANLGANLGFKFIANTKAKGLGIMFTVDGMYNCLQKDIHTEDFIDFNFGNIAGLDMKTQRPSYLNIPIMLGLNYAFNFTDMIGIFVEGGAGVDARFVLPGSVKANGTLLGTTHDFNYEYHYTPKFAFAYQIGGGFIINKVISVGVSYYNLGISEVAGHTDYFYNTNLFNHADSYSTDFSNKEISTSMLLVRLGIRLQ